MSCCRAGSIFTVTSPGDRTDPGARPGRPAGSPCPTAPGSPRASDNGDRTGRRAAGHRRRRRRFVSAQLHLQPPTVAWRRPTPAPPGAVAVAKAKQRPLSGASSDRLPVAGRAEVATAIQDASVHAFRIGMLVLRRPRLLRRPDRLRGGAQPAQASGRTRALGWRIVGAPEDAAQVVVVRVPASVAASTPAGRRRPGCSKRQLHDTPGGRAEVGTSAPPSACRTPGAGRLAFAAARAPVGQLAQRAGEIAAAVGQLYEARRAFGVGLGDDQAPALEVAQPLGEHVGGDAGQLALQVAEAPRAVEQRGDDQQGPAVADRVQGVGERRRRRRAPPSASGRRVWPCLQRSATVLTCS